MTANYESEGLTFQIDNENFINLEIGKSILYDLEPMGIGSVFVESLTSYMGRLALSHCLLTGTLIGKLLAPAMNKGYLAESSIAGGSRFYESSASINGLGKEATDWTTVIERLNLRTDLRYLTMLHWHGIFPVRNLIKNKRTWCPQCLSEQKPGEEYEYLIWNLQIVEECPVHHIPLESVCPICGKQNYVISRRHVPGYCNRCWGWLGEISREGVQKIEVMLNTENHNRVLENLRFLIEYPLNANSIQQIHTTQRLNLLLEQITEGNINRLATVIGRPKATLWGWINAKNKPTIGDLCDLCSKIGITLRELYFGDMKNVRIKEIHPDEKVIASNSNKREYVDFDQLRIQLEEFITDNNSISMRQVARELNTDKRLLYNHYPELCKQISSNYARQCSIEKAKNIQIDCGKVEKAAQELNALGVYPSRRAVEGAAGAPLLRRKEVQDFWKSNIINKP